jgi:hypothetical protein
LSNADCTDERYPLDVYVAPLTALTLADWDASTSDRRIGAAYALICTDRPPWSVSFNAVTSVTFPEATVNDTCTDPNWVCSTAPRNVPETTAGANGCQFEYGYYLAQLLDGASTAGVAVAEERDGLPVPLGEVVVEQVLECGVASVDSARVCGGHDRPEQQG